MDLLDRSQSHAPEFLCVHFLQDRHRADQMVRRLRQRKRTRFRGQQLEAFVNLKRIRADNFGIDVMRDIRRQFGFSGRGRPDDEEDIFHVKAPVLDLINTGLQAGVVTCTKGSAVSTASSRIALVGSR